MNLAFAELLGCFSFLPSSAEISRIEYCTELIETKQLVINLKKVIKIKTSLKTSLS